MISEKLQNAINEQITAEMWSANLYLSMSFYFEKEGFMPRWQTAQADGEMVRANCVCSGARCARPPRERKM